MSSRSPSTPVQAVLQVPASALLSFLKQASLEPAWNAPYLANVLSLNNSDAKKIIETMQAFGYIEPADKPKAWRNTEQGNKMAGAKRPRLKRENADRLINDLLSRARQLHHDDRYLFEPSKAIVFGDYLTVHDPIQDIDVAVELRPKHEPAEHRRLLEKRIAEAERSHEHFKSFLDEQKVAQKDVLAALKGRSRGIKIHQLEPWMQKRSHRVVLDE